MINCNNCMHIDFTEKEQHELGLKEVPGHKCTLYKRFVFHGNNHNGKDFCIKPCTECLLDANSNYQERNVKGVNKGTVKDGWYYCPYGHKTSQRIEKDTHAVNLPIWCKHCKEAYYPRILNGVIVK